MKLSVRIRKKSEERPAEECSDRELMDTDADGISDAEEEKIGTDPRDADSDHDGLRDYEEIFVYGTDPLDPDTDRDGISDGEEVSLGYNPKGRGKLKDFFIASRSNNHRPHALRARRILFYAFAALAIKAVVVISLLGMPMSAWLDPDVALEQSRKIISLTNQIRAKLGLGELKESVILDQAAAAKAQDMLSSQYFAHISPDNKGLNYWLKSAGYGFLFAGENLAMGFSDAPDVVNAWIQSKTHYANMIDPDFTEIGVGMVTGAYKQYDTTFVAQMFGKPKTVQTAAPIARVAPPEAKPSVAPVKAAASPAAERQVALDKTSATDPIRPKQPASAKPLPAALSATAPKTAPEASPSARSAEPASEPPAKPLIISPENNYLSNSPALLFKVLSADAQKVLILSDGVAVASSSGRDGGLFRISADIQAGIHAITAVAQKGQASSVSEERIVTIDLEPPLVDSSKSGLALISKDGEHDVVAVTAFLSADTAKAEASFNNYNIALSPDASDPNKWTGEALIFKQDNRDIFNPVVLASVTATDYAGSTVTRDIVWGNIIPSKQSLLNQYLYLKNNQSPYARALFDVSSMFYKVLLIISMLVLSANIYLQLHKRHPHIIASALGLIALLVVLILV